MSERSVIIWVPFYIGDYLRETQGLSRCEHGSYLLLRTAYISNGGPLEDDDAVLRDIAKCPAPEWERTKKVMLRFFVQGNGVWRHSGLDAEITKVTFNQEAARSRTEAARAAKLQKHRHIQSITEPVTACETSSVTEPVTDSYSQSYSQSEKKNSLSLAAGSGERGGQSKPAEAPEEEDPNRWPQRVPVKPAAQVTDDEAAKRRARIVAAHDWYCRATGGKARLDMAAERLWYEFFKAGHTEEELRTVLAYLRLQIREKKRNMGALKLENLIATDRFSADLNLCRTNLHAKIPAVPGSNAVEETIERPEMAKPVRQTPEERAASANALAELRKCREELQ